LTLQSEIEDKKWQEKRKLELDHSLSGDNDGKNETRTHL